MMEIFSYKKLYKAYLDCRKNKRNTESALEFEWNLEENLYELHEEIRSKTYKPGKSNCFVCKESTPREIFAAEFKDRVVHHLLVREIEDCGEKVFIHDSYSCRPGKGTHFGIKRVSRFLRQATNNYQKEAWVLKLDIKGYFMSIDKKILLDKLIDFLRGKYNGSDKEKIIWLCKKIIMNDPTKNCTRKSPKRKWVGLPKSKSLFYAKENCGLPVGNYTNQVFANFYLNSMDHFIKSDLKIRYYGRYVDDFILISTNKQKLKNSMIQIQEFLSKNLKIKINTKKTYFQPTTKGFEFLGVLIKPYRKYISSRVKNNFLRKIKVINRKTGNSNFSKKEKMKLVSQVNSYLGMLKHYNTYDLRFKFFKSLDRAFWNFFTTNRNLAKIKSID